MYHKKLGPLSEGAVLLLKKDWGSDFSYDRSLPLSLLKGKDTSLKEGGALCIFTITGAAPGL